MTNAGPPKPAAFAAGDVVGGRYRLVTVLGEGGMGTVWRALHLELGVNVAVKLIPPALIDSPVALARFQREARAAATIRSPHVVTIHDYGTDDGRPYLVMELLPGEDLRARLDHVGRVGLAEAAKIITGVCKALRLAHDLGIVHRDLKPGNIFLASNDDETVVKVLDFGIAKDLNAATDTVRTASDALVGSPRYMSPEQVRGSSLDHRSDLWSAGVVLYEMVTGHHPFDGDTVGDVLLKIGMDEIPPPSSIIRSLPVELDAFFTRALARKVDARFPDASALALAFRDIALAPPETLVVRPAAPAVGRDDATLDIEPPNGPPVPVAPAGAVSAATPGGLADTTESALTKRIAPARATWRWVVPSIAVAGVLGTVAAFVVLPGLGPKPEGATVTTTPAEAASQSGGATVAPLEPAPPPSAAAAPPPSASVASPETPSASSAPSVASAARVPPPPKAGPGRVVQGPVREPPPVAPPKPTVDPTFGVTDTP